MESAEKYPYLFDEENYSVVEDMPEGWKDLLYAACDKINEILDAKDLPHTCLRTLQMKEKFGALRWYFDIEVEDDKFTPHEFLGLDYAISDIIDQLEIDTEKVCCNCGKPSEYCTTNWIMYYCGDCIKNVKTPYKKIKLPCWNFN